MELSRTTVLSEEEIKKIDEASKQILEETGVKVYSKKVLDLYKKGGAIVDEESMIVKIPQELTEKCIRSTPQNFKLYDRDRDSARTLGDNIGYCASGHNAIYVFDHEKKERRPSTKQDIANFAKISDALKNIHIVGVQAMPQDVQAKSSILHALDALVNHSSKHFYFSPENVEEAHALITIIKAISGEKDIMEEPIGTCQLSPISPLTWSQGTAEAVVEIAKAKIPLCLLPQPYCGVTSPITIAGTLVTNNAEELSGIVLAQIVNEGTPIIYGAAWTTFEMSKGAVLIGTPERCLLSVGGAQIAKYYKIPSHCIAFDTDSNLYDEQNGFEKIFNLIATLQSGINLVVNAGMFSTGMTVSYEQLVIDDEIAQFVYRYLKGIQVDEDTLARDVIKHVGQHQSYMMEPHTLKYIKLGEHASYQVSNREVYDIWKNKSKPSIEENARAVAEVILQEHQPKELPDTKKEKIQAIIRDYESRH